MTTVNHYHHHHTTTIMTIVNRYHHHHTTTIKTTTTVPATCKNSVSPIFVKSSTVSCLPHQVQWHFVNS
jgi:hypothetical protein